MSSVVNTAWDRYLKPFLVAVTVSPTQRLKLLIIGPIDRDRNSHHDLEAARQQVVDKRTNSKYDNNNLDWATIIVVFCLTTAIGIALLPFQGPSGQLHLPVIFYFLGLSVILAFTCILLSKFIHFNYCPGGITIAPIFHQFGLFFGVTAFFISISIPFPLWFKCAALSIYVVTFLLVVLCNLHFNKYYKIHGFKYPTPAIDPTAESCGGSASTIDDQACTNSMT
ncbi:hypothetical protein D8674_007211 [Pyrus ussuriensis x Pyrus communis]|uniref:Uncharacterized protein n=1 Tax=Pyrus ussuriensis x Pyrus communis TaxID=2448454 RepID=A0A5N5GA27_9ROSA|nr:hypothetical protein D8674_007211 [Pyrus ussuriensis x Pyrus communis]